MSKLNLTATEGAEIQYKGCMYLIFNDIDFDSMAFDKMDYYCLNYFL
jgi:hypothetical protein